MGVSLNEIADKDALVELIYSKADFSSTCKNLDRPIVLSINNEIITELTNSQVKAACFLWGDRVFSDFSLKTAIPRVIFNQGIIKNFRKEWGPKLKDRGISVPIDDEVFAEIVFSQPDYKNKYQELEENRRLKEEQQNEQTRLNEVKRREEELSKQQQSLTTEEYRARTTPTQTQEQKLHEQKMLLKAFVSQLSSIYNYHSDMQTKYDKFYVYLPNLIKNLKFLKAGLTESESQQNNDITALIEYLEDIVNQPVDLANKFHALVSYKHKTMNIFDLSNQDEAHVNVHIGAMNADEYYKLFFYIKALAELAIISDLVRK